MSFNYSRNTEAQVAPFSSLGSLMSPDTLVDLGNAEFPALNELQIFAPTLLPSFFSAPGGFYSEVLHASMDVEPQHPFDYLTVSQNDGDASFHYPQNCSPRSASGADGSPYPSHDLGIHTDPHHYYLSGRIRTSLPQVEPLLRNRPYMTEVSPCIDPMLLQEVSLPPQNLQNHRVLLNEDDSSPQLESSGCEGRRSTSKPLRKSDEMIGPLDKVFPIPDHTRPRNPVKRASESYPTPPPDVARRLSDTTNVTVSAPASSHWFQRPIRGPQHSSPATPSRILDSGSSFEGHAQTEEVSDIRSISNSLSLPSRKNPSKNRRPVPAPKGPVEDASGTVRFPVIPPNQIVASLIARDYGTRHPKPNAQEMEFITQELEKACAEVVNCHSLRRPKGNSSPDWMVEQLLWPLFAAVAQRGITISRGVLSRCQVVVQWALDVHMGKDPTKRKINENQSNGFVTGCCARHGIKGYRLILCIDKEYRGQNTDGFVDWLIDNGLSYLLLTPQQMEEVLGVPPQVVRSFEAKAPKAHKPSKAFRGSKGSKDGKTSKKSAAATRKARNHRKRF